MNGDDKPIGELVGRLIDDGKAYARAEIDLARAKVEGEVDRARSIAILLGAAAAVGLAALVALAVTLVLSLASLLGPLGGGAAATAIFASVAGLLVLTAKGKWERRDGER